MVLWEITLGTAYFLGLKRTYKLALRIQRRLISPKHPKVRQFVQRVHRKIQERDIEVGRSVGNWILRYLDKKKPEAKIRGPPPSITSNPTNGTKQLSSSSHPNNDARIMDKKSDRHFFSASRNAWSSPTIAMMRPAGYNNQYRQYRSGGSELFTVDHGRFGFGEVLRNDIGTGFCITDLVSLRRFRYSFGNL